MENIPWQLPSWMNNSSNYISIFLPQKKEGRDSLHSPPLSRNFVRRTTASPLFRDTHPPTHPPTQNILDQPLGKIYIWY